MMMVIGILKDGIRSQAVIVGVLFSALCSPAISFAVDFDFGADVSVTYSDNIDRRSDDGEDDTVASVGVFFGVDETSSKHETRARGDLRHLNYLDDTFGSETLGALDLNSLIHLVDNRFDWSIENNFGQVVTDPFRAVTPENREDINYFTTGPDVFFKLGPATTLLTSGRYSNTYYEETDSDNDQYSGSIALQRALAPTRSLSLYLQALRVEFDNEMLNSNYDVQNAFVRFSSKVSRSNLSIDAGVTELHDNGDSNSNPLFRASWQRQLQENSSFQLSASTQYQNTGSDFRGIQSGGSNVGGTQNVDANGRPYESEQFDAQYSWNGRRAGWSLQGKWTDDDYDADDTQDRKRTEATVNFTYSMTSNVSSKLRVYFQNQDYQNVDRDDDDLEVNLEFGFPLSRSLSITTGYTYYQRDSNSSSAEYEENRGYIGLEYNRPGGGSARSSR